jgi:hypothetical protein
MASGTEQTPFGTEQSLCRVLVAGALPPDLTPTELDAIWAHATWRSVDELLAAIMCRDARIGPAARQRAVDRLRDATAREMLRFRALRSIVGAVDAAGLRVLLMKGAGLAYTVYPEPHLRPAGDIDLLIPRDSLEDAEAALAAIGYRRQHEPDAELASMQRHYVLAEPGGVEHVIDLHWRVANRHLFADAVSFEEAWADSELVPRLGDSARTLGTVDAVMLACIHRVAHHDDHPDLIWLWDIHLLAGRLTGDQVETLLRRAAETGMRAVLAHSLNQAATRFGTRGASALLDRLTVDGAVEPAAALIAGHARPVDLLRTDLASVGSARQRLRLLREHLLPGLAYMRAKYPAWPRPLLPLAYLYRIARGAPKWFRRP